MISFYDGTRSFVKNNTFTIRPLGGLCNRLRVIFSYYKYCEQNNLLLNIVWESDKASPFKFEDYFLLPDNCTITENGSNIAINHEGYYHYSGVNHDRTMYDKLYLQPSVRSMVMDYISSMPSYSAVHIRKTDLLRLLATKNIRPTDDYEYDKFINQTDQHIYLATDNAETQTKYKNKFGNKIIYYKDIAESKDIFLRQTSTLHSIIDLYLCINANQFLGTYYSSFTDLINIMRD